MKVLLKPETNYKTVDNAVSYIFLSNFSTSLNLYNGLNFENYTIKGNLWK